MQSASEAEVKQLQPEAVAAVNDRSSVEFPYTDLDSAIDVVRGVHGAGGNACDSDQLAAELGLEAKGGGFRQRINGAKTFGLLTYERGGRTTLTDLGRQMIDPSSERAARVQAFLAVELYQKVHDQFKGGPLPPQAGLDRALVAIGVGAGVKEKARQVMMRSAKQAGFLEYAPDRLVKPSVKQDSPRQNRDADESDADERQPTPKNSGGGGSDGGQHPLIQGLLVTLPQPGGEWSAQERVNWLTMASSIFKMIYTEQSPSTIQIAITGGATSAS